VNPDFPVITSISPASATPGAGVEIHGSAFGEEQGTVQFRLPGGAPVAAEVTEWTPGLVRAEVPALDQFGSGGPLEVVVETEAGPSAPVAFVLLEPELPAISAVVPANAQVEGHEITVRGTSFGRNGAGQRLLISRPGSAAVRVDVTVWEPDRLLATLPSAPALGGGGRKGLVVETPWGRSAPFEYTVRELPRIASVSPPSGRPGNPVEIRGTGFGTDEGEAYLRLPGDGSPLVAAQVDDWQATSITVRVPPLDHFGGGGPLGVLVQTSVGRSGPVSFTLLEPDPPAIDAIAPEQEQVEHGEIVVSGTGFGRPGPGSRLVFLTAGTPAVEAEELGWSRTEIRARVPSVEALGGAGEKEIKVLTPWGESEPQSYEVGELPKITGLSNEEAPPGAHLLITGRAFGPRPPGRIRIETTYEEDPPAEPTVIAVEMEPISWTETGIEVNLPRFEELRTTGLKDIVVTSRWGEGKRKITILDRGSITSWTRLEPHARHDGLQEGLALGLEARIYDPLWLLARQDQLLELRATDGGSPVRVRVEGENAHLSRWQSGSSEPRDLPAPQTTPLEAIVERERVLPPVAEAHTGFPSRRLAVEAGLQFLRNLDARLRDPEKSDDYRKRFVRAYPVPAPTDADRVALDAETVRFLGVMENRAPDGAVLYERLRVALPPERGGEGRLPDRPPIGGNERGAVMQAITDWFDWCADLFSEGDPSAYPWNPERMEYDFAVSADLDASEEVVLAAPEYDGRRLDWHSFVRLGPDSSLRDQGAGSVRAPEQIVRTVMATPVTFPGAPVQRWWEIEGPVDFGAVAAGPADLVRLFFVHFATVYGGDWFWVPVDAVPAGSLCRVDRLIVTDTFGDDTEVQPFTGGDVGDWRMFDLSRADEGASPGLVFLPGALPSTLESAPLEDVRLFRDELANLAWAVEHTIEGPMGRPLDRHEAYQHTRREADISSGEPPSVPQDAPPLTYRLARSVPPNWFPLLPRMDQSDGEIVARRLVRGAMLDEDSNEPIPPEGRLLEPERALVLYDEEVPRTGARLTRVWQQGRAPDGSTHLWLGRRRDVGRGEGSSGLRFDLVERRPPG